MIFIKKFPQEECVEEGRVGHGTMHQYPSHPSKRLEKYMENSSFCDSSDSLKRLMKQTQENEKLKKILLKHASHK